MCVQFHELRVWNAVRPPALYHLAIEVKILFSTTYELSEFEICVGCIECLAIHRHRISAKAVRSADGSEVARKTQNAANVTIKCPKGHICPVSKYPLFLGILRRVQ